MMTLLQSGRLHSACARVLPILLSTFFALGALPGSAQAGEPLLRWQLRPNLYCLFDSQSCVRFYPASGGPPLVQSPWSSVTLPVPGQLCVEQGPIALEQVETSSLLARPWSRYLASPGCLYLTAQEVSLVGAGVVEGWSTSARKGYESKARAAGTSPLPAPRLGQLSLAAQPEGTRFEAVVSRDGRACLRVKEGQVTVSWRFKSSDTPVTLNPGDSLSMRPDGLSQESWTRLDGAEASWSFRELKKDTLEGNNRSFSTQGPERLYAAVSDALARPDLALSLKAVRLLQAAYPTDDLTQQALALVALKAHRLGQESEVQVLRQLLVSADKDSAWLKLLDAEAPVPDDAETEGSAHE